MDLKDRPRSEVMAIWEDRVALANRLLDAPDWEYARPGLRNFIADWIREPVDAMEQHADRLTALIQRLEEARL